MAGFEILCVSTALLISFFAFKQYKRMSQKKKRQDYPKDTVVLHQIGRGKYVPSISPFPLKLETYLRMANIPYINDHDDGFSKKGKTPWITYNGEDVADSQFCIDYLNEKLNVDLNKNLSKEERAIARAFLKMTEENLYWCLVMQRWVYEKGANLPEISNNQIGWFLVSMISRRIRGQCWSQGMGRHGKEEVLGICRGDLGALSDYLGSKPYFMGEKACEVDCAIFGMLAQCVWSSPNSPQQGYIQDDFSNLKDFCYRMKEAYWPDWDSELAGAEKKKE